MIIVKILKLLIFSLILQKTYCNLLFKRKENYSTLNYIFWHIYLLKAKIFIDFLLLFFFADFIQKRKTNNNYCKIKNYLKNNPCTKCLLHSIKIKCYYNQYCFSFIIVEFFAPLNWVSNFTIKYTNDAIWKTSAIISNINNRFIFL